MKFKLTFCVFVVDFLVEVRLGHQDWSVEELNCLNELKLDHAKILKINKQVITPEDNADFNNFLACHWKKRGIQNANGEIDFEQLDDLLLLEILREYDGNPDFTASIVAGIFETAVNKLSTPLDMNIDFERFQFDMNHIKVFFAALLVVMVASKQHSPWSKQELICLNELKLDKSSMMVIMSQLYKPEDNQDFNKFLSCYWKKLGIQKEDGEVDFEKIRDLIKDEFPVALKKFMEETIIDCQSDYFRAKTHGLTAVRVHNCLTRRAQQTADYYNFD